MCWAIPAAVAVSALGSYLGAKSQERGLEESASAQREGLAGQERMYQQGREDYRPWREAGTEALDWARKNVYNFANSPVYERQSENLNRQLAARGLYGSGAGVEAQSRMAENEGQRQYDRIMQLAGFGPSAAGGMAGLASGMGGAYQTAGANLGNIAAQQGQARGGLYSSLGQLPLTAMNAYQNYQLGQGMQDYYNKGLTASNTPTGGGFNQYDKYSINYPQ